MVLPESVSVADSDQGDALLFHVGVQVTLDIDADGTCALVEDGVLGLVVDQATHGHPLLLTATEHVVPVVFSVPATFTADEVLQADLAEECGELII